MDPIFSSDCDRPHRVLRQVSTQLQFRIFQEAREFVPQSKRVVAGLGQCAPRQCRGACDFDLLLDHTQQRSRLLLTQSIACLKAECLAAGFAHRTHEQPRTTEQPKLAAPSRSPCVQPCNKGKGQSDFSDWPLFMPAMTYAPTHLARAVPSALRGLTSVFGMGTGGSPAVRSPTS
jgi:hypothetical protein